MTEMFGELERRHVGYGYLGIVDIRSWEDRGECGILGLGMAVKEGIMQNVYLVLRFRSFSAVNMCVVIRVLDSLFLLPRSQGRRRRVGTVFRVVVFDGVTGMYVLVVH